MENFDADELQRIGQSVEAARSEHGWSKEEASRYAAISSITWKRVEDGLRVQPAKLRAVEKALSWPVGSMGRIARRETVATPSPEDEVKSLGLPSEAEAKILAILAREREAGEKRGSA